MATNQWLLLATYSYRIQITGDWIKIAGDKVDTRHCWVRIGLQGVLMTSLAFGESYQDCASKMQELTYRQL